MRARSVIVLVMTKALAVLLLVGLLVTILVFTVFTPSEEAESVSPIALTGRVILVDPGHGGMDPGTDSAGVRESDVTLAIAQAAAEALVAAGADVYLTRESDVDLIEQVTAAQEIAISQEEYARDQAAGLVTHPYDRGIALGTRQPPAYRLGLRARLLSAETVGAAVLLSIHVNYFRAASAKGAGVVYREHCQESRKLGESIQSYLAPLLPGRSEPTVYPDDFFLLRRSPVPAVIIETGFLSNPRDRAYMLSAEGQAAMAAAITTGVEAYFSIE